MCSSDLLPIVNFTGLSSAICISAVPETLTGAPLGGTFSGNGISVNIFDPAIAGVGSHIIKYVYSDGGGCTDSTTQTVVVNPLPTVTFSGLDIAYCIDDSPASLVGSPSGGTFTGPGVSGNSFDPVVADSGVHVVTYVYSDEIGRAHV